VALAFILVLIFINYYISVKDGVILQTDYSGFQYLEHTYKQVFPRIIFYDPHIGAGIISTIHHLAAMNLFLSLLPLNLFLPTTTAHKFQPIFILIITPLIFYASTRLLNRTKKEALIAAFFGLIASPHFFDKFYWGGLSYIYTCLLSVFIFSIFYRIFVLNDRKLKYIIALLVSVSLAWFNVVFFIIMLPIIPCLFLLKDKKSVKLLAITLFFLFVINFWAIWPLTNSLQDVFTEAMPIMPRLSPNFIEDVLMSGYHYKYVISKLNPLILLAGAFGLYHIHKRHKRNRELSLLLSSFIIFFLALSLLGIFFVTPLKPHRFTVPLMLFMAIPASVFVNVLIKSNKITSKALVVFVFIIATLLYIPYYGAIRRASPSALEFPGWIKENTGPDSRIYFESGSVSDPKIYGGNHLAFYQVLIQRDMVAEPFGIPIDTKKYMLPEIMHINKNRLGDFDGPSLCSYFDLFNIGYVVVWSEKGKNILRSSNCSVHVDDFVFTDCDVCQKEKLSLFKTNINRSYFLDGSGNTIHYLNTIEVNVTNSTHETILKFYWHDKLRAFPDLLMEPYPTFTNETLIKVFNGDIKSFVIKYS
jgi:hypothetical protein